MASSFHLDARDTPLILSAPSAEPYTSPSLTANLICRVLLAVFANFACFVPLRLLYKNNELAAVVYIVNLLVENIQTILFSLLWRNDNLESWWPGYGLCDATPYVHNFSLGLFVTCLLAIMRNIAQQVSFLRANPLSVKEKRKRNLVQALIMFPLPLLQAALTWPLTVQRYAVGTLIGCVWVAYPTWQYVVFFVLAPAVIALITAGYAVLTFIRFRELSKTTESALSSNRVAEIRAQRTKRRLYLMVVTVLIPFLPIVLALTVVNLVNMGPVNAFDYSAIHGHQSPYPWNSVIYSPSNEIDWVIMNTPYISILAVIPLFLFFGMTKDAVNDYRRIALFLGLGRFFPRLYQEYDPDRGRSTFGSNSTGSSNFRSRSMAMDVKVKSTTSSYHLASISSFSGESSNTPQNLNFLSSVDLEAGKPPHGQRPEPSQGFHVKAEEPPLHLPHRNPFLLRTRLDFPIPFVLPFFNKPASSNKGKQVESGTATLDPLCRASLQPPWDARVEKAPVQTRVWADEEAGQEGRGRQHNDNSLADARHLVTEVQGVRVETALTRESHQTD